MRPYEWMRAQALVTLVILALLTIAPFQNCGLKIPSAGQPSSKIVGESSVTADPSDDSKSLGQQSHNQENKVTAVLCRSWKIASRLHPKPYCRVRLVLNPTTLKCSFSTTAPCFRQIKSTASQAVRLSTKESFAESRNLQQLVSLCLPMSTLTSQTSVQSPLYPLQLSDSETAAATF
jgi:hypothetical protein